jgi:hypothetical protein
MPRWFYPLLRLTPIVASVSLLAVVGLIAFRAVVPIDELRSSVDAVGNYLQTVGGIYAVLLAFVVYVVWGQYNDARGYVDREATAIVDLHRTATGLPEPTCVAIQEQLRQYVDAVIADEWRAMTDGNELVIERVGARLDAVWAAIHRCRPSNELQQTIYGEVLSRFNDLSDLRTSRLTASRQRIPLVMRILLYIGALITIGSMYLLAVDKLWVHAVVTAISTMRSAGTVTSATLRSIARVAASIAPRIDRTTAPGADGPEHAPFACMHYPVLALTCGLAACSSSQQHVASTEPRSWAEHMESAQQHEQRAAEHEELSIEAKNEFHEPGSWVCCDTVIQDQVTTGGQPVTYSHPWYNIHVQPWWRNHRAAQRERDAATSERQAARDLAHAALAACGGVPERERSLLTQPDVVAEIIPHRVTGQVRGVTLVLRPSAVLTADRVRRDVQCGRAMWALHGERLDENTDDPTLVPDAEVAVHQVGDQVVVIVSTTNDEVAQLALARARGPLEQSAQR